MGSFSITNIKQLAEDVRNNDFEGLTISSQDPDDLGYEFSRGRLPVDVSNTGLTANSGLGDKISETIEGEKVGVFAQGRKLFESTLKGADDLRIGASGNPIFFDSKGLDWTEASSLEKLNPDLSIPEIESGGIKDLFQALNINKVSFRPVKNEVPENFEGPLPGPEKVKEKTKTTNLGLILPVVAGLSVIYLVIRK